MSNGQNIVPNTVHIVAVEDLEADNSTTETIMDTEKNFNCSAISSQSCGYKWKWFDGVHEEVVSHKSTLTPQKPGWYKCESECFIRGKQCTVLSRLVHVSESRSKNISTINSTFRFHIVLFICLLAGWFIIWLILATSESNRPNKIFYWKNSSGCSKEIYYLFSILIFLLRCCFHWWSLVNFRKGNSCVTENSQYCWENSLENI